MTLPGTPGATKVYQVRWTLKGSEMNDRFSRVQVTEGYSTTEDFAKILAIRFTKDNDPSKIDVIGYVEI